MYINEMFKNAISKISKWLVDSWLAKFILKWINGHYALKRAINTNDIITIDSYLEGTYKGWRKLFGYPKIKVNDRIEFSGKEVTMLHIAAKKGNRRVIGYLLERGADSSIQAEVEGEMLTPLQVAIANVDLDSTKDFIRSGYLKREEIDLALHFAAKCRFKDSEDVFDMISGLLNIIADHLQQSWGAREGISINSLIRAQLEIRDSDYWDTPLHVAARCGNIDAIEAILPYLEFKIRFARENKEGKKPSDLLDIAIPGTHPLKYRIMEQLLSAEGDLLSTDKANILKKILNKGDGVMKIYYILCKAILNEDIGTLEECIQGTHRELGGIRADVNELYWLDKRMTTMLHLAAKYGKIRATECLLKQPGIRPNIEVEYKKNGKLTALHVAIVHGQRACIARIFDAIESTMQADDFTKFVKKFYIRKSVGGEIVESMLHFAAVAGQKDNSMACVVDSMCRSIAKKEVITRTNAIDEMLQKRVVSEPEYGSGKTLLHIAAEHGNIRTATQLLRFHAEVNAVDTSGETPLHAATRAGKSDMVNLLLRNRANKDVQNKKGQTALSIAKRIDNPIPNQKAVIDCLNQVGFFGLPVKENDGVKYARDRIREEFKEELGKPNGLRRALIHFKGTIDSYIQDSSARIAVIGMGGAGKTSLINAFAGEEIGETGEAIDTTKFPTEYIINGVSFTDFPGFGTVDFRLEEFKQLFCWESYDIVFILVNSREAMGKIFDCLKFGMRANRCENVIFCVTHLNNIYFKADDDLAKIAEIKKIRMANIAEYKARALAEAMSEEKAQNKPYMGMQSHVAGIEENKDIFFISTPDPRRRYKYPGFDQLERVVRERCSIEGLKERRIRQSKEIARIIEKDLSDRYSVCEFITRLARGNWTTPRATATLKTNDNNELIMEYTDSIIKHSTICGIAQVKRESPTASREAFLQFIDQ